METTQARYKAYVLYRRENNRVKIEVLADKPKLGPFQLFASFDLQTQPSDETAAEALAKDLMAAIAKAQTLASCHIGDHGAIKTRCLCPPSA